MYTKLVLLLSKDGSKLEKKVVEDFKFVEYLESKHNIHPELERLENYYSLDEVSDFLNSFKEKTHLFWHVQFFHKDNNNMKYLGHQQNAVFRKQFRDGSHKDTIDEMIQFIEQRKLDVAEEAYSSCTIL